MGRRREAGRGNRASAAPCSCVFVNAAGPPSCATRFCTCAGPHGPASKRVCQSVASLPRAIEAASAPQRNHGRTAQSRTRQRPRPVGRWRRGGGSRRLRRPLDTRSPAVSEKRGLPRASHGHGARTLSALSSRRRCLASLFRCISLDGLTCFRSRASAACILSSRCAPPTGESHHFPPLVTPPRRRPVPFARDEPVSAAPPPTAPLHAPARYC